MTLIRGRRPRASRCTRWTTATILKALDWMRGAPSRIRPAMRLGGRRRPPHLLHEHPPGRDLGRGPRQPGAPRAWRSSSRWRPDRPSAWACACPGRRPRELAAARRRWPTLPALPGPPRPVRLHHERLPLRRRSTARWSRRRSTAPTGWSPSGCATPRTWPTCWPRCCRARRRPGTDRDSISTVPGCFRRGAQAGRRRSAMATRRSRWPRAATLWRRREAGGPPHRRWRWSPSPSACWRPPPTACSFLQAARVRRARGWPRFAAAHRPGRRRRRGGPAPPRGPVPGRLPRGRRVRGRRRRRWRRLAAAGVTICKLQVSAGLRMLRPDRRQAGRAAALRRGGLPAPGGDPPRASCSSASLDLPAGAGRRRSRRPGRRVAHPLPRPAVPRGAGPVREHPAVPRRPAATASAGAPFTRAPRGRDLHLGRAAATSTGANRWPTRSPASCAGRWTQLARARPA